MYTKKYIQKLHVCWSIRQKREKRRVLLKDEENKQNKHTQWLVEEDQAFGAEDSMEAVQIKLKLVSKGVYSENTKQVGIAIASIQK